MTDQRAKLGEAMASLQSQLVWRGPTGRVMGHIVLEREHAAALLAAATVCAAMMPATSSESPP
jgi:hypothetical protein